VKKPPENLKEIVEYFGSPLEIPELNHDLYFKPYHSETDDLITKILSKRSDGSRTLSPFSLLDSSVVIPPIIDDYKTAYFLTATTYGDYVDLYIHEKPIIKTKSFKSRWIYKNPKEKTDRSGDYRRRNSIKALNKIRQLTLANFTSENVKLLTLTFGDCGFDITNPKICNKLLSKFLQDLRKLYPEYRYLSVIEFQKRGAVHYHILCDLPFIDKEKLAKLWGYGFIDIRKPDYLVGSYLFKYLSKTLYDEKLKGVRVYFYSKNLDKPILHTGLYAYDIATNLQDKEIHFANQYKNKYNGDVVKYRQFKVSPDPPKNL
jgi:hypothetical protein